MTDSATDRGAAAHNIDLDRVRDGLEAAVAAAAHAILEVRGRGHVRTRMKVGEGPVTEADHAADDVLHARLMPLIAGGHWLSEESEQQAPLIPGEPTWVVDPLDGTREFLLGFHEYGVSVGLFVADRLTLGAVALPHEQVVLSGLLDGERREARRNGEPLNALAFDATVHTVVVSRHDYEWREIHHQIPHKVYPCGSSAVKLAHVVEGQADVYLSTRSRSVWDVAGGAAVLEAAGGALVQVDGTALTLSPQRVGIPPFVAGTHERCLALLRVLGAEV